MKFEVRCSKFECREDIHFKIQPGPVPKNAKIPTGNWTRALWISIDQRSTNWATEAVADTFGIDIYGYFFVSLKEWRDWRNYLQLDSIHCL